MWSSHNLKYSTTAPSGGWDKGEEIAKNRFTLSWKENIMTGKNIDLRLQKTAKNGVFIWKSFSRSR